MVDAVVDGVVVETVGDTVVGDAVVVEDVETGAVALVV